MRAAIGVQLFRLPQSGFGTKGDSSVRLERDGMLALNECSRGSRLPADGKAANHGAKLSAAAGFTEDVFNKQQCSGEMLLPIRPCMAALELFKCMGHAFGQQRSMQRAIGGQQRV